VHWWEAHHEHLQEWARVVELIKEIFKPMVNPQEHMCLYERNWIDQKNSNTINS
jgi:hypothetical protein